MTLAPAAQPSAAASPRGTTVVRTGSTIAGTITGAGDVVVEGLVEGDIKIDGSVTIAAAGRVTGNIHARSVAVSGTLTGNIVGGARVEVLATGTLKGDITAQGLVISDGAALDGRVQIDRGAARSA